MTSQPVLLLYSPPSDPTQSYTSVPTLAGHLRRHGVPVIQRDLGIEVLDQLLTRESLTKAWVTARGRRPQRNHSEYANRLTRAQAFADYVTHSIERAKGVMRRADQFYELEQYRWAVNIIDLACELASLPHHPSKLTAAQYVQGAQCTVAGLLDATGPVRENLFRPLLEGLVDDLLACNPSLVGISITYHFQVIPGLTLARILKERAPKTPVVVGGAIISRMESHLLVDPRLFEFADYFVVGEGETALLELARATSAGDQVGDVPNLIRLRSGRPYATKTDFVENIRATGLPDYDGLQLECYLSPEPVILLPASRGCYWGKCTFCDVSRQTRTVYRPINRTSVVAQMAHLRKTVGARRFFFCDDAVPLGTMSEIAAAVQDTLPGVTWQAEARLEKGMSDAYLERLAKGGCRQLMLGYESSSQRVLDQMQKNNTIERDREIIRSCYRHGIGLNLQTFIGLPTESEQEAWATVDFLAEHERYICSIGFSLFALWRDTPIYNYPEAHGVTNISIPLQHSLLADCDFETTSGMSRNEAMAVHARARRKLGPIFKERSLFLGGAAGAHTLLHLSEYSFRELYDFWSRLETRVNLNKMARDFVRLSPESRIAEGADVKAVFVPKTGSCIELANADLDLLRAAEEHPVQLDTLLNEFQDSDISEPMSGSIKIVTSCERLVRQGALEIAAH